MTYPEFIAQWRDESEHIECHTSGSTGTPKIIRLPKRQMDRSARRTAAFFGLNEDSLLYSCISPDYIGGKMMAVRADLLGCRFGWETPSNHPLENWDEGTIDLLAIVPSQALYLLEKIEKGNELPQIKHIIIGGAPLSESMHRRIANCGLNAWETYGMTETASHIALRKVGNPESPFIALPDIRVSTAPDSRLTIEIEGWQRITTNDIAQIVGENAFHILGRADNVIITGGKKVNAERLESRLEDLLGYDVLISGEPDEKWGSIVVMTVEDDGKLDDEAILATCRESLPPECRPKKIKHEMIQRTKNGKKIR